MRRRREILGLGVCIELLLLSVFASAHFAGLSAEAQGISCDVPPSSDWAEDEDPSDYLLVGPPGWIDDNDRNSDLRALDKDLSTEWSDGVWSGFPGIRVDNNSATTIAMVLEPGKMYTFCIDFSSRGDAYLLTESNMDMYTIDFYCQEDEFGPICNPEEMDLIPVEYRDLATWIPFRDSHAYESVSYEEFSVAIDSSGSAWSFAGFGESRNQVFYLVLDGFDNSRPTDQIPSGNMSVEILVDVEKRQTLPKITAYLLIGALPLSCIIIPLILHWKYHSSAPLGADEDALIEVPFLNVEERPSNQGDPKQP